MLSAERRRVITDRLRATGRVVVSALSAEFDVSEETIRRDLDWIEKQGIASRTYGGAVLAGQEGIAPPYSVRKNTNIDEKISIAQCLASIIQDGDTIMVDESSTSAYAMRAIHHLSNITLITNSQELLREMGSREGWRIISTGGILKPGVMALVGTHALRTVSSYHVKYSIFSCRGINTQLGLADSDDEVVQIKRAMLSACDKAILLCDHRKFDRSGFTALGELSLANMIITDREPSAEWKQRLIDSGIELIIADQP